MGILFKIKKNQVFQHFKKFYAMVQWETEMVLKYLQTDNEGEYMSNIFEYYYSEHDIRHEKIISSTTQNNGVAEKINHTIVKKVRSSG